MQENALLPNVANNIDQLCHDALEYICTSTKGISENITYGADALVSTIYQGNYYGIVGYVQPYKKALDLPDDKPLSFSNLKASFFGTLKQQRTIISQKLTQARNNYRLKLKANPRVSKVQLNAEDAMELKGGNCEELACLAYQYLQIDAIALGFQIYLMKGINFDHVYIALGKLDGEGVQLNDMSTWPKDTRILDPWLHSRFQLEQMPDFWRDMAHVYNWGNMQAWVNCDEIMEPKTVTTPEHPFFKKFVPQVYAEYLNQDAYHQESKPPAIISEASPISGF
ncbi:MAG: hypothetical protein HKM04_03460 [Legionellales bacterium]|nr:hypothetical protein [Legionellales bacterium]